MGDILTKILAEKKKEVNLRKERGLFFRPFWERPRLSLKEALTSSSFAIIAEIKRASPSKGLIAKEFDPIATAKAYLKGGASAISCLTDEKFFRGHLEYLAAIREYVSVPILRKDFIIDEIQLEEAKAFGADAVLLIVAALTPKRLKELLEKTHSLGLEALVEVHNEAELNVALEAQAQIIGINNRNLKTFEVSLETSLALASRIPRDVVLVSESGIKDSSDIGKLKKAGISAALIGESLMRAEDKARALAELLKF